MPNFDKNLVPHLDWLTEYRQAKGLSATIPKEAQLFDQDGKLNIASLAIYPEIYTVVTAESNLEATENEKRLAAFVCATLYMRNLPDDLQKELDFLVINPGKKRLDLSYDTTLGMKEVLAIANILPLTWVRELHLTKVFLDSGMLPLLIANKELKTLLASECSITDEDMPAIAASSLKTVISIRNHISSRGLKHSLSPALTHLNLSENNIHRLPSNFTNNKTLRRLQLAKNFLDPTSLKNVASMPLRWLAISQNLATPEFFETLSTNKHLKYLFADSTSCNDTGAKALSSMPKLRLLYLSNNPITDAGICDLAANPTLSSLNVSGTACTRAGLHALAHNTTLEVLNIAQLESLRIEQERLRFEQPQNVEDPYEIFSQTTPDNYCLCVIDGLPVQVELKLQPYLERNKRIQLRATQDAIAAALKALNGSAKTAEDIDSITNKAIEMANNALKEMQNETSDNAIKIKSSLQKSLMAICNQDNFVNAKIIETLLAIPNTSSEYEHARYTAFHKLYMHPMSTAEKVKGTRAQNNNALVTSSQNDDQEQAVHTYRDVLSWYVKNDDTSLISFKENYNEKRVSAFCRALTCCEQDDATLLVSFKDKANQRVFDSALSEATGKVFTPDQSLLASQARFDYLAKVLTSWCPTDDEGKDMRTHLLTCLANTKSAHQSQFDNRPPHCTMFQATKASLLPQERERVWRLGM